MPRPRPCSAPSSKRATPPPTGAPRRTSPPSRPTAPRGTDPYPVPDDAALLHQLVGQTVHHLRTADIPCLATLAAVDAPTLEWHTRETLGLGTHRLDAWATSVVTRQLLELRYPERVPAPGSQGGSPVQRGGVHVGAFGWVTGLRPRDSTASQGFVHTPSMGHAATAAILRSAWTARGEGSALAPAAVDIQSARVRTSEWLLDGVRNGQALGDLLGYRLERYLHAIDLDALIAPLRHSVGAGQVPPDTTAEDPVDGLEALELWRAGTLYDGWPVADHPVPTDAQKAAVAFGLGLLELAFDAIDDATLFEATHQLVAGNIDRAGAVIASMGDVDLAPPELVAQRTPTAGPTIDHRVMVLIDAAAALRTGPWSAGIRSKIAPQLESWVANLLPPPSTVGFRIGTGHDAVRRAARRPRRVGPRRPRPRRRRSAHRQPRVGRARPAGPSRSRRGDDRCRRSCRCAGFAGRASAPRHRDPPDGRGRPTGSRRRPAAERPRRPGRGAHRPRRASGSPSTRPAPCSST